jgi:hypothetical protein
MFGEQINEMRGFGVEHFLFRAILEVLIAVTTKSSIFRDVMPCSLVEVYRWFIGKYCLQLQG